MPHPIDVVRDRFLEEVDSFEMATDAPYKQVAYDFEKKQRMIERAQALGVALAYAGIDLRGGYEAEINGRCRSSVRIEYAWTTRRCLALYHGDTKIGESYWYTISPSGRYLVFEQFDNLYAYDAKTAKVTFISTEPFRSCMDKWYEELTPPVIRCFDVHNQTVREVEIN